MRNNLANTEHKNDTYGSECFSMSKKSTCAPYLDHLIHVARSKVLISEAACIQQLLLIVNEMSVLNVQGEDELRRIWLDVPRGTIDDYGTYEAFLEDEIVDSYEAFVEMWEYEYPESTKWYEFSVTTDNKETYFYIDSTLTFQVNFSEERPAYVYYRDELIERLVELVQATMSRIKTDVETYNEYINKHLSYDRRFGKIERNAYWSVFPEEGLSFRKQLNGDDVQLLESIVQQSAGDKKDLIINKMTAGDFFEYCKIGYLANGYVKAATKTLRAVELYKRFADGRDEGLTELTLDTEADFMDWYTHKRGGGHPWEICRGGNSTHISLYVQSFENGWLLVLDGSSCSRVVETVKMAVALYKNQVPFVLNKALEIERMIKGIDYIGIVPRAMYPRYCGSYFPSEDRIIDFMNLCYEKTDEVCSKATWYPLKGIELNELNE